MPTVLGPREPLGVGPDANRLALLERENQSRQRDSVTFARTDKGNHKAATDILFEAWAECATDGWDGEHAQAVTTDRLKSAVKLVSGLPWRFPPPDACGEADGDFCLEWYRGPRRVLAVSIGPNGILHWSALIGDDDLRGTWRYSPEAGDAAPEMLRQLLSRLYP